MSEGPRFDSYEQLVRFVYAQVFNRDADVIDSDFFLNAKTADPKHEIRCYYLAKCTIGPEFKDIVRSKGDANAQLTFIYNVLHLNRAAAKPTPNSPQYGLGHGVDDSGLASFKPRIENGDIDGVCHDVIFSDEFGTYMPELLPMDFCVCASGMRQVSFNAWQSFSNWTTTVKAVLRSQIDVEEALKTNGFPSSWPFYVTSSSRTLGACP